MRSDDGKLIVSVVPVSKLDGLWPIIAPILDRAISKTARGRTTIDDLYDLTVRGDYMIWLVIDVQTDTAIASFTTRVIQYPRARSLVVDWGAGIRMNEWLPMVLRELSRHAKNNTCTSLEGQGRGAWGRILKRYGWSLDYSSYRMEL